MLWFGIACGDDGGTMDSGGTMQGTMSASAGSVGETAAETEDAQTSATSDDDPTTGSAPTTDPATSTTDEPTTEPTTETQGETGASGTCDNAAFLVCENFEAAAIGANPDGWDLRPSGVWGGNDMGVTDEQAAWGSQAFRVRSGETGAQWLTYMGDISAFADGHWGRMYFRMSDPVPWPAGGVIHGDLFEARGNWMGSTHQVRWAVINNASMLHNWGYNVQTSNAGEFIYETGYEYPWTTDWLCIEWHHDQAAQTATLWVDGEELVAVTAEQDPQLPVFDDISVGWANYQTASPEFVVYIDEVVLDDERVGCL